MKNDQKKIYMVFNNTDGFFASPDVMTKEEAEKFIEEFPSRYERQGYYRTNTWEKIRPEDVELEIRPLILRSREKNKGKERTLDR